MLRLLSLFRRAWWGTLSNALWMSKKTHITCCFLSKNWCQWWTATMSGTMVERPFLKPNWESERTEFDSKCSSKSWWRCFSRHLLRIDSREIGRNGCTLWQEDSFGIGTTWESFQSDGIWPFLMERLKREDTDGAMSSEKLQSIQEVTPSGPVAEWGLMLLKRTSASWSVQSYLLRASSREASLEPGVWETVDGTNVELKEAEKN